MTFTSTSISFQNRYKNTDLVNGVAPGDSVAMRQLTPVLSDVQSLIAGMTNYVRGDQFGTMFNQLKGQQNLQDGTQVNAAIAAALANLPDPEQRLASVAVHSCFQGPLADLIASVAGLGLTASDSGNTDDANVTCVLLDSPTPGESGMYQLRTNGSFQSLNAALLAENLGYYTRFYINGASQVGREFAVTGIDVATNKIEVGEIPYSDEYTGLGPINVSNVNKTINIRFDATDFVMGTNGFSLHPSLKLAIASIPGLQSSIEALSDLLDSLNSTLTAQISALTGQVSGLIQTVQGQANSISGLQSSVQDLVSRLAASFADVQEIFFSAGVPKVRGGNGWTAAPATLVEELSGDADAAFFRVKHNRGRVTMPQYFEANALGEPKRACFLYDTQEVTPDLIEIRVEKYKPVLLLFEAGLKGSAFAVQPVPAN